MEDLSGAANLSRTCIETIDIFCEKSYHLANVVRYAVCPHCSSVHDSMELDSLEKNAFNGVFSFVCPTTSKTVSLSDLAPDVAMEDFIGNRVDYASIQFEYDKSTATLVRAINEPELLCVEEGETVVVENIFSDYAVVCYNRKLHGKVPLDALTFSRSVIGSGAFGKIYQACWDSKAVAIKELVSSNLVSCMQ
jgi:hypothetical protein